MDALTGPSLAPTGEILARQEVSAAGLTFRFVSERVITPTAWNLHDDRHVFVVHRAGRLRSMTMQFEHGPAGRLIPQIGDVWVIPAGNRYSAMAQGDTVEYVQIIVPVKLIAGGVVQPRAGFSDPFLLECAKRFHTLCDRSDSTARLLRERLASTIRLHLRDSYVTRARQNSRDIPGGLGRVMAKLILEHIDSHLDSALSLESLAAFAGLPVSNFIAAFTATFGTSPYQFVLDRRVLEAQRLLTTTDMAVQAVGTAVGFATPSHFAATFRQRTALTPREYRAENGRRQLASPQRSHSG